MIQRSNSTVIIAGCGLLMCLVPLTARASVLPTQLRLPASSDTGISLVSPVAGASSVRSFLAPTSDYSSGHRGIDYAVSGEQSLVAPSSGTIHFNGLVANRNVITIKRANGDLVSFEPSCSDLSVGTVVTVGQNLGRYCPGSLDYHDHCEKLFSQKSPRTGSGSTLRCLHFSYRTESGYLSPDAVMGLLEPSRLAPWTDV